MKKSIFVFIAVFLLCNGLLAQNIAYIYSAHNNYQYKDSFDGRIKNMTVIKFENTDFKSFTDKKDDFDILLLGTVCNYANTINFADYKKELADFVQKGGIIFVTDASYPSSCDWVPQVFGMEFIGGTDSKSQDFPDAVRSKSFNPLYRIADITPLLEWSRVKECQGNWTVLFNDESEKPYFVIKDIGTGLIAMTPATYGSADIESVLKALYDYCKSKKTEKTSAHFGKLASVWGSENAKTEWTMSENPAGITFDITCYDSGRNDQTMATASKRDENMSRDDSIDIFIANKKAVYRFSVNYLNTKLDALNGKTEYNTYFESDVIYDKDFWKASLFIPFASLGINSETKKEDLKFNIVRNFHFREKDPGIYVYKSPKDFDFENSQYMAPLPLKNADFSIFGKEYINFSAEPGIPGKNVFHLVQPIPENYVLYNLDTEEAFTGNGGKACVRLKEGINQIMGVIYQKPVFDKKEKYDPNARPDEYISPVYNTKENTILASFCTDLDIKSRMTFDVIYPNYRAIVQSKDPQKILKAKVLCDVAKKIKWTIDRYDSRPADLVNPYVCIKEGSITLSETNEIICDISDLEPGKYRLYAKTGDTVITGDNSAEQTYEFEVLPPSDFEVTFDEKNICYLNGTPFFPIGIYHSMPFEVNQHKKPEMPEISLEQAINDIKDHGINTAMTTWIEDQNIKKYTDSGMLLNVETAKWADDKAMQDRIDMNRQNNTGLFYYTVDEPIGNAMVSQAKKEYDYYRQNDPHRPVSASVNLASALLRTNDCFDIMMSDPYIFLKGTNPSLWEIMPFIENSQKAGNGKKPVWITLQAFGMENTAFKWKIPTRDEVRAQAWFSIANGVTGILWYAYATGEPDPASPWGQWYIGDKDIWEELKTVNSEINEFLPVLVKGEKITPLKCSNDKICSAYWKYNDKTYAILVNGESSVQTCTIDFPAGPKPCFDGYEYSIKDNTISFKPYESIIICF